MINAKDQEELFRLIADYLSEDTECVAIGGTAMMFQGYKNSTKDIDLVFKTERERKVFIQAIEQLGYSQKSLKVVYPNKSNIKNKPLIYSRGEERFDLFVKDVFGFEIDFSVFVQRNDFIGRKELIVFILSKEYLILLKSVTNREKDFEDIERIVNVQKDIDWGVIVDSAIKNRKNNPWILYDLEETLQKLRKITFIKKQFFEKIYAAEK
jgi:hypothetical protein